MPTILYPLLWLRLQLVKWRESWSLRHIPRSGGRPYLQRIGREQSVEQSRIDKLKRTWRVRLHRFVGPDDAGHHNHPFEWALSINISALWGASYTEEVLIDPEFWSCHEDDDQKIIKRRVRFFNWIPNGKYHRIIELHGRVVTIFITGPRVTSWGFWVPGRGHVHHRQYSREQGNDEAE